MTSRFHWLTFILYYRRPSKRISKCERERIIVEQMIRLYCRHKEHNRILCDDCQELISYTAKRLRCCKFGENKPTCQSCPIHCYSPKMKEKIKAVMRFSGPRMIFIHPIITIKHLFHH